MKVRSEVVQSSEARNREHGITGVLCSYPDGSIFLQALAGARFAVNTVYANIVRDGRHRDVTLSHDAEIEERRFAGWRMGTVDLKRINASTILRFSEKALLDPFSMSGAGALALLEELASTAAISSRGLEGWHRIGQHLGGMPALRGRLRSGDCSNVSGTHERKP